MRFGRRPESVGVFFTLASAVALQTLTLSYFTALILHNLNHNHAKVPTPSGTMAGGRPRCSNTAVGTRVWKMVRGCGSQAPIPAHERILVSSSSTYEFLLSKGSQTLSTNTVLQVTKKCDDDDDDDDDASPTHLILRDSFVSRPLCRSRRRAPTTFVVAPVLPSLHDRIG